MCLATSEDQEENKQQSLPCNNPCPAAFLFEVEKWAIHEKWNSMSASGNNKAGTRGASAGWGGPAVLNHSPRDNPPRRGPAGEDLKAGGRGRTGAWGENSKEPAGEEVRRAGGTEGSLWKDPGFCSCGNRTPLEDTEQTSQVWLTCSSALSDFQDQRQMHGGQQETTKSNQEVTVTQTRVVTVQVGRHGQMLEILRS